MGILPNELDAKFPTGKNVTDGIEIHEIFQVF